MFQALQVRAGEGLVWIILICFKLIQYDSIHVRKAGTCLHSPFSWSLISPILSCSFLATFCDMGRNGCTGMRIVKKQQHFDQGISVLGCLFVCVCVWGQPLFPRDLRISQFFSFKA